MKDYLHFVVAKKHNLGKCQDEKIGEKDASIQCKG